MDKIESFEQYLATQTTSLPVLGFIINLVLAALLASVVSYVYQRYANSVSNRKSFANNFVILTMVTMVVIAIVKSSLALSLGLVGALSIVRFRSAIKEPEELIYLFLSISIGLGLGADQRIITILAVIIISLVVIIFKKLTENKSEHFNLYFTISGSTKNNLKIEDITRTLSDYCSSVDIKRFDETENMIEVSTHIEFTHFDKVSAIKNALQEIDPTLSFSFIDTTRS
jgi:hypothetical protein